MAQQTPTHILPSLLLFLTLTLASAQNLRTINVSGKGTVTASPSLVTINTGVETTSKTAEQALSDNNLAFNRLLAVLKAQNIDDKDIQTTFFNVRQQFARKPNGQRAELTGHTVTNTVQVRVRDVKSLGMVLDALVKAGSNTINGISFSIAEPTPLEDRARALAVADARRRAALYARAGGVKLGNIISISEQPITVPVQREDFFSDAFAKGGRSAGVSIASGELDVMATVFVLYEIRR